MKFLSKLDKFLDGFVKWGSAPAAIGFYYLAVRNFIHGDIYVGTLELIIALGMTSTVLDYLSKYFMKKAKELEEEIDELS